MNSRIPFLLPFLAAAFLLLQTTPAAAQQPADTLDVVNWNLEWFCDGETLDPADQIEGARSIMNRLNADVYALAEIVDVDSLASLAASLNGGFSYVVASYASFADHPASSSYAGAQKLALIYRSAMLRNVSAGPLLRGSNNAYYNFSSGRYPFRVQADVLGGDGQWRAIAFIVLHAKANSDYTSCQRRTWGARELKDSLDRHYPDDRFLLLGDFNDDLNTSICPSTGGVSNYLSFLNDSGDYKPLTLPLSKAGAHSIDGFSTLIDHVIASNEMHRYYVPGSAASLETLVKGMYPDYRYRISDHYPIITRYVLDERMRTAAPLLAAAEEIRIYPQPAGRILQVVAPGPAGVRLFSLDGRLLLSNEGTGTSELQLALPPLSPGVYQVQLRLSNGSTLTRKVLFQQF